MTFWIIIAVVGLLTLIAIWAKLDDLVREHKKLVNHVSRWEDRDIIDRQKVAALQDRVYGDGEGSP